MFLRNFVMWWNCCYNWSEEVRIVWMWHNDMLWHFKCQYDIVRHYDTVDTIRHCQTWWHYWQYDIVRHDDAINNMTLSDMMTLSMLWHCQTWWHCWHYDDIVRHDDTVAVSHRYGYGVMDAGAMVDLASRWFTVPEQHVCAIPAVNKDR